MYTYVQWQPTAMSKRMTEKTDRSESQKRWLERNEMAAEYLRKIGGNFIGHWPSFAKEWLQISVPLHACQHLEPEHNHWCTVVLTTVATVGRRQHYGVWFGAMLEIIIAQKDRCAEPIIRWIDDQLQSTAEEHDPGMQPGVTPAQPSSVPVPVRSDTETRTELTSSLVHEGMSVASLIVCIVFSFVCQGRVTKPRKGRVVHKQRSSPSWRCI